MKRLLLFFGLLVVAIPVIAQNNYIVPGARQETNGTNPVVVSATNIGTTASGNALLLPNVSATFGVPSLTGTLTSSAVTASGTVTANTLWINFLLSSDFVGTINGVTMTGATVLSFAMSPVPGYKYPAIAYTRSAGTLTITTFQ